MLPSGPPPVPRSPPRSPMRRGVNVARHSSPDSCLHRAAFSGDVGAAEAALGQGAHINAADSSYGSTALMIASANGHAELVELLLKAGARRAQVDMEGRSALLKAARRGHLQVVELLLDPPGGGAAAEERAAHGVGVGVGVGGGTLNLPDETHVTPLMVSSMMGHSQVVRYLLSKGAEVDLVDETG